MQALRRYSLIDKLKGDNMNKTIYELNFLEKYILNLNSNDKDIIESDKHEIYEEHIINKHGKERIVYILSGKKGIRLSKIQKELTNKYLAKQSLPYPVKGFIIGESYNTFLSEHIGNNFFLRLDIKDFFKTINSEKINKSFSDIIKIKEKEEKGKALKLIEDICLYSGFLPQGACSSPAVSNIIFSRTDQRILKYCQTLDVRYTRYADDLLFSSKNFNFKENIWFTNKIKYILADSGFKLNYKKTLYSENGELNLNGYILNNIEVRISRKRFRKLYSVINTTKNVLDIDKTYLPQIIYKIIKNTNNFFYYKPNVINCKVKGIKFYYLRANNNSFISEIRYKYIPIDRVILSIINFSIENNSNFDIESLEINKNKGNWEYPKYSFKSMNAIVEYLLGQRSYLISWISKDNTYNQKRIKKAIYQIEDVVDKIAYIYD